MRLTDKRRLGRLGSFWHSNSNIRKSADAISDTINAVDSHQWARYIQGRLLGRRHIPIPRQEYTYGDVITLGVPSKLYEELVDFGDGAVRLRRTYKDEVLAGGALTIGGELLVYASDETVLTEGGGILILKSDQELYAIEAPDNMVIYGLQDKDGNTLIAGSDFESSSGVLLFYKDPNTLFEGKRLHILSGHTTEKDLLDYTERSDHFPTGRWLRDYFRYDQSVQAFLRAVAVQAGLYVIEEDCEVLGKLPGGYLFSYGPVYIGYDHTALVVGDTYTKGHIIGELSVSYGRGEWWQHLGWGSGLPIGEITGFGDVVAPFENRQLTTTLYKGNLHPYIPLDAYSDDLLTRFWNSIWDGERRTGKYICADMGLVSEGDTETVNPADFFLRYGLASSLIRFDIKGSLLVSRKSSILRFIREHRPVGSNVMLQINDG